MEFFWKMFLFFSFHISDVSYENHLAEGCWTCVSDEKRLLCYWSSIGSDTRPQVGALLSDGSGDGWSLHFTLVVHNYARIVLEVDEDSISSAEGLALSYDNGGHDLRMICCSIFHSFVTLHHFLTFFLSSGLPFFTVATNISPTPAAGKRFKRPRMPWTAITYKFLPPKKRHQKNI